MNRSGLASRSALAGFTLLAMTLSGPTWAQNVDADLAITKTDGVTTATPGGSVTYTVTASNAGPSNVTGATVADTFPASLTATWTCVGAGGGTCTAAGAGNINQLVNLPAGGSVTFTASATISAAATGTLSNTATVTAPGGVSDPVPGNNSATDTDTLTPQANLAITKTDGVTTATPGGSVTYTITASNAGPSNAPAATVADTFPAGLTCNWTCIGAGGGLCGLASGAGDINDPANLPAGGSVTYTASCTIASGATGSISNTATVTAPDDPVPGNNSATDTDTLTQSADLAVSKSDGVTSARPGDALTYAISVTNAGPSDATGANVLDSVPPALTGCSWTCAAGPGSACTASGTGDINDIVHVASGSNLAYSLAGVVASNTPTGPLSNTVSVAFAGDPNGGDNVATDTDTVTGSADIAVGKTVSNPTPTVGTQVTYTVTATNNGPANATGVVVTDVLPNGLAFVSSTASQGTYASATGLWSVGTVANGATATLTITATVNRSQTIVNQATRTAANE